MISFREFSGNIVLGDAERYANGQRYVPVVQYKPTDPKKKAPRKRWSIQTPVLSLPFGLNQPYNDNDDDKSVDVSFRDMSDDVQKFMTDMERVDARILEDAVANSEAWFGKTKSREVLEDAYKPIIRRDSKGMHPPTMKIKFKLNRDTKEVLTSFFDEDRNEISIDDISKGMTARFIIEADRIYFINNSMFGISWKAVQMQVMSRPATYTKFAMLDDDDEAVLGLGGGGDKSKRKRQEDDDEASPNGKKAKDDEDDNYGGSAAADDDERDIGDLDVPDDL